MPNLITELQKRDGNGFNNDELTKCLELGLVPDKRAYNDNNEST
jgi:hypothetical protein